MDPHTLAVLIEQAREKVESAQREHLRLQRLAEQAQAHLTMLHQYAGEYDERSAWRPGDLRDPGASQNQRHFMGRLQHAVQTQARELAAREEAAGAAGAALNACRRQQKSLETLLARRKEHERLAQARRDQKSTDEFAQRAHERSLRERRLQDELHARKQP
jgi:flagellar FliJ protein